MPHSQASSAGMATTGDPTLAARLNTWMLALACGLASAAIASSVAAQQRAQGDANSIKRFLFSSDTFEAVETELDRMGVAFADAPEAPAPGRTTWSTGTGPSGLPTPYALDHGRAVSTSTARDAGRKIRRLRSPT